MSQNAENIEKKKTQNEGKRDGGFNVLWLGV